MKNIVLIGMTGSGKTTVAKKLLDKLSGFELLDVDKEIEKFQNMTIDKIFEKYGERFFRELEVSFIKKFSMKSSKIIATGGGAAVNQDNIANLQQRGVLFYLKCDVNVLYQRLKNDKTRPKLKNGDLMGTLENMLEKRAKGYKLADFEIDTSELTIDEIAGEIIEKYEQFCG